jgi:pimeloyl-CoA synthetase
MLVRWVSLESILEKASVHSEGRRALINTTIEAKQELAQLLRRLGKTNSAARVEEQLKEFQQKKQDLEALQQSAHRSTTN